MAAVEYLGRMKEYLAISDTELRNPLEKVSFVEPRQQGVEYRLGKIKELFDATTIIFNQTFLNVPVWRAAITLTIKHNPNRILLVNDTTERGMNAELPSREKIEEHKKLFALAAAEQSLRVLGLESQAESAGLVNEDAQPATAPFVRQMLGRSLEAVNENESAPDDDARAIRGRFFVYRYSATNRLPLPPTETPTPDAVEETPSIETSNTLPTLSLPEVDSSIKDGAWRVVSEVTFALATPEYGKLNWRALVDVETDSVLLLEPLVAGENGMVFHWDPITTSGDNANSPDRNNSVLNPFRSSVPLPNLNAPTNGEWSLQGRFAVVTDLTEPRIFPPTAPAGSSFDYDVRTNDFAAVNAYYHTDRFFTLVESLGFPIQSYFDKTIFPVPVDHRDNVNGNPNAINARCVGNGEGGIGFAGYALNDLTDIGNPVGRACDSRVHFHELGGHGILYEHVDRANFGFAHSAGDSLSAIFHDPESRAQDRYRYAPWNPSNDRRFDRSPAAGWAWGGTNDDKGYGSEQILCTTMFRVYQSIGGDSNDKNQKRFASRMVIYLILRAVSNLTPATNPRNALGFANELIAVDLLNWTSEGVFGGAYNKVIRWSFEKQGLFQSPTHVGPVSRRGQPPDVDVFIDDGRAGEYDYQENYSTNQSIWNRRAPDGGTAHQDPVKGVRNFAYVKIKNRGITQAQNVRVRGFHRKPGAATTVWPIDFEPLTTVELAAGTLKSLSQEEKVVGPFEWIPTSDALGQDALMMVVSANNDPSNINNFTEGETVPEWRLVPNDNNIGLRNVTPISAPPINEDSFLETGDASAAAAEASAAEWSKRRHAAIATAAAERLQTENARNAIARILDESGESSLGEAARWADRIKERNRPTDPATNRFLGDLRNRSHNTWHYVNLPLGLDGYDRQRHPEFTRNNDIVQTILVCIESLRAPGPRARFEEITALRWLTHLIGDLHQPVHIGCGYIANPKTNQARLVTSPDVAIGLASDRGGGDLVLPIDVNLHSYWDGRLGPDIVPDAINAESDDALVAELVSAPGPAAFAEDLDIPGSIVAWANESLRDAREAYQGIRITAYDPQPNEGDYRVEWEGEEAYELRCAPIVSRRMSAAASNLAQLLDAIWAD